MCCLENEAELRTDLAAPTLTITELSPLMVMGLQNILTKCPGPAKSWMGGHGIESYTD